MINGFLSVFNNDRMRPFRFLVVGGGATVLHVLIASVVLMAFDNASPYLANIVAFLFAFLFSFYGHKYITFKTEGSVWKFFLVAISGFVINNLFLSIMLALNLPDIMAIVIATLCIPILTYLASYLWAFKKG